MKRIALLLSTAAILGFAAGCAQSEVEPQQMELRTIDGSMIIFKDLYEINSDQIIDFGKSRVFPIFNTNNEYLPGEYDIGIAVMEASETSALFTQDSSQVIYVLAGGGMLMINDKAYELREGITIYIPPKQKLRFINNSPYVLKYMTINTPSNQGAPIILEKAPENSKSDGTQLSDKEILTKSEAIKGNAATTPTLDQISPVTLQETRKTTELMGKNTPATQKNTVSGSDRTNTQIINRIDNLTDPPPVKPIEQNQVKSLTPVEEKIMKDKD